MSAHIASRRCNTLSATISAVLVGHAVTMLSPSAVAADSAQAAKVRGMNAQVLQVQFESRRAANPAAANAKAKQVLAARAEAMAQLMVTDPTAAEKLAFPASVLESLSDAFPAAATSLEQRGQWSGELEYLIEDGVDLRSHREVFKLRRGSEVLELRFSGREPPALQSGQKLSVGGIRSGRTVVASEVELTDSFQGGSVSVDAAGAVCGPTGAQGVLAVLVNLPGYTLPSSMTTDFVRGALLGNAYAGSAAQSATNWSVDDFWQQASDGKTRIDPANTAVLGPVALSSNHNTDATGAGYCDYPGLRDELIKVIDGQVDFRKYSRIKIILPPNGACGWAGVANLGCRSLSSTGDGSFTASVAWQRADTMTTRGRAVQLTTHEMGHNLGMSHASSRDFGAEALGALGSTGTLSEYGDVHSTMGSWNFGFYAASHAANQLSWLGAGTGFQTVESSGTYTISHYEARGGAIRALKIRRGTGNDAWLWVESRQNVGLYSSQLSASLFGGALIHYQDTSTGNKSHLVDFTTATSGFSDAALPVGATWTDPYSNTSVTVNSVTTGSMAVTVNYSGATCNTAAPTVVAAPTGVATEYGSSASFTVTVKNNSSLGCASETFDLSAAVPSGWSTAFGNASLSVGPGQQAQTTLAVGVPSPHALGTYAVTSSARSAASSTSGSDTGNVTVVEPANTLSLGISGSGSVSFSAPAKACTSSCTTDYAGNTTTVTLTAIAASKFQFTGWLGACSGTMTSCTVAMSGDRTVNATFKRAGGAAKR